MDFFTVTEHSATEAAGGSGARGGRIDPLLSQFSAHQRQRGVLPSSITRREADIRKFDLWLEPGTLIDATPADIEAFLAGRGWCDVTRYAFISHLHAFYRWAVRQELVELDPTAFIDRPRVRRGLPRPITNDDLSYLLAESTGRMRAWLMLAGFAGLRCIEISRLERCDVVTDELHYLRVLGKGDKERIVPLHPLVLEALRQADMPRSGVLWRTGGGYPFSGSLVSQTANRWIHGMGVDATMHRLRHWFGTHCYQLTQDILAVADLMGHSNPTTTSIYAKFNNRVARDAVFGLTLPNDPQIPGPATDA